MADSEHLEILKQGSEAWNVWRAKNIFITPCLAGADLRHVNLHGAILYKADMRSVNLQDASLKGISLSEADLRGADLIAADLSDVKFSHTNLSCAALRGANLRGANLCAADLSGANLALADLRMADLSDTKLTSANLLSAYMAGTLIGNVDLSEVKNLESVEHVGPSTVGIDTIYKSRGNISEVFLRGCGVPEDFITYMRSLTVQPIQFYSCFISYSSKDQEFADRMHADLQVKGVRVWFAPHDMRIGARIRPTIDESIRVYDKLLLVLSKNSVGSRWVEQEVETALAKEEDAEREVLFPVRLDETVMKIRSGWPALVKRTRHVGDFTNWKDHDSYQKAFDRLLRDLKAEE